VTLLLVTYLSVQNQGEATANNPGGDNDKNFDSGDFLVVGGLVIKTLMISAVIPPITCCVEICITKLLRWWDRGCTLDFSKTKCTSIHKYVDLYSGPEFLMHYKYSQILTVTYVTFMYGFGLPLLFPVAFISIGILYFTEKTMLYYVYKSPPMYNIHSNQVFLKIMRFAPLLFCAVGYWMCSNWSLLHNTNLVNVTEEKNLFKRIGWYAPGWPLLLLSIVILLLIIFDDASATSLLGKFFPSIAMDFSRLDTNNDLKYWEAITYNNA